MKGNTNVVGWFEKSHYQEFSGCCSGYSDCFLASIYEACQILTRTIFEDRNHEVVALRLAI
jgi:hypothetical protein